MKRYTVGRAGLRKDKDGECVLYIDAQALEEQLADSLEVNTAAYMLGVEDGKRDAMLMCEAQIDRSETIERWVTGLCCVCKLQMDCSREKCGCENWTAEWADDIRADNP